MVFGWNFVKSMSFLKATMETVASSSREAYEHFYHFGAGILYRL